MRETEIPFIPRVDIDNFESFLNMLNNWQQYSYLSDSSRSFIGNFVRSYKVNHLMCESNELLLEQFILFLLQGGHISLPDDILLF